MSDVVDHNECIACRKNEHEHHLDGKAGDANGSTAELFGANGSEGAEANGSERTANGSGVTANGSTEGFEGADMAMNGSTSITHTHTHRCSIITLTCHNIDTIVIKSSHCLHDDNE